MTLIYGASLSPTPETVLRFRSGDSSVVAGVSPPTDRSDRHGQCAWRYTSTGQPWLQELPRGRQRQARRSAHTFSCFAIPTLVPPTSQDGGEPLPSSRRHSERPESTAIRGCLYTSRPQSRSRTKRMHSPSEDTCRRNQIASIHIRDTPLTHPIHRYWPNPIARLVSPRRRPTASGWLRVRRPTLPNFANPASVTA